MGGFSTANCECHNQMACYKAMASPGIFGESVDDHPIETPEKNTSDVLRVLSASEKVMWNMSVMSVIVVFSIAGKM